MDTFAPFAPTVVTDHRPGAIGPPPVGLRALLAGAFGGGEAARSLVDRNGLRSVEAIVVFDFGAGSGTVPSPVNAALAESLRGVAADVPVLAQHETATVLGRGDRIVIDLEEMARQRSGMGAGHVDTSTIVDMLTVLADRAGWTSVGVVAHPAHVARCVATCQRRGLRVVAAPVDLDAAWDRSSSQWWTRRRAAWAAREVAVVAHQMLSGHVLLRL